MKHIDTSCWSYQISRLSQAKPLQLKSLTLSLQQRTSYNAQLPTFLDSSASKPLYNDFKPFAICINKQYLSLSIII